MRVALHGEDEIMEGKGRVSLVILHCIATRLKVIIKMKEFEELKVNFDSSGTKMLKV